MRLIDADALKEELNNWAVDLTKSKFPHYIKDDADCIIDNAPTIDAVPVRYGMWVDVDRMQMHDLHGVLTWGNSFMCTECNFKTFAVEGHMSQYHYCPNCGARMDGENDE